MNESRLKNTAMNAITGFINQFITLGLTFISRTIFIHYLGIEYLGINSLFANILQVLSMADLGFGTALVFSMYKPIADEDEAKLASLMRFYKKIYNIVAIIVSILGVIVIPFLPLFINTENPVDNLALYYTLYLMNTVVSYLFVYKTSIAVAHQKSYVLNNFDSIFAIVQNVLQIITLIYTHNFVVYLLIQIICSLMKNLFKAKKSEKLYPYINHGAELTRKDKLEIFTSVKSMFIYRVGGVLLNNTDNIIISIIVGTTTVGYYSNYLMITNAVLNFTNIFFNSMTASIGNLNVKNNVKEKLRYFEKINFMSIWLFNFCGICFYVLFNDFITLWLGEEFVLNNLTLWAIVLNFVMPGTLRTVSLYRDTTGMFKETKYIFFITSIINAILSVILGRLLGLSGVLLATIIARLLTNMWYEPMILFKKYFFVSPSKYFKRQFIYWVVFLVSLVFTNTIINFVITEITILTFIFKVLLCLMIPNIIMIALYKDTVEYKFYKKFILDYLKKKLI